MKKILLIIASLLALPALAAEPTTAVEAIQATVQRGAYVLYSGWDAPRPCDTKTATKVSRACRKSASPVGARL